MFFISHPLWLLNAFELVLHPALLCIIILNIAVVYSSAILHPNFRIILIAQSASIFVFELTRLAMVVGKFADGNMGFTMLSQNALLFSTFFRNHSGHILIAERLLATFYARKYETYRKPHFCLICLPILLCVVAINVFLGSDLHKWTLLNVVTCLLMLAICFVELLLIGGLRIYNARAYRDHIKNVKKKAYKLEEKFQMSENIRTSRQLLPAFACHFANNLISTSLGILAYWNLVEQIIPYYTIASFLYSLTNGVMEITVMTHHPMLRKRVKRILMKLFCKSNRIEAAAQGPTNIHGNPLIGPIDTEAYLKMIEADW